ncbi:MAG: helix-turn-helix domain-containing protein [Pseudomonadota bacterium]
MAKPASSYGQYCPLALAAELLCRRWTLLIVSRLLDGCETFNEIHAGVPRISPSLLSRRLGELVHAGLATREAIPGTKRYRYLPTAATRELDDTVMGLAAWGQRWARDMDVDDLDPAFLAWSMSQRLNPDAMPVGRTVVEFEFSGTPTEFRRFWLVSNDGHADMCLKHPGYETDLLVQADLRCFVEAWRGIRNLKTELRRGSISLTGPPRLKRALPDWLLLSALASYSRQAAGRERQLASHRRKNAGDHR